MPLCFGHYCRMTLLLGPPGAGKTILLKALAGKLEKDLRVCDPSTCYYLNIFSSAARLETLHFFLSTGIGKRKNHLLWSRIVRVHSSEDMLLHKPT